MSIKNPILNHLLSRRSVLANNMMTPGPDEEQIFQILTAAARVPDHKKLVPWRFILFQGEARQKFGAVLAGALIDVEGEVGPVRLETERGRFTRAPLVIAVVSSVKDNPGAPEWEQILSAGAVCQNLLVAATSLGFAAQWITEWYAYNPSVREQMGLSSHERVAGFVYIGTAKEPPLERDRPDLGEIVTKWEG